MGVTDLHGDSEEAGEGGFVRETGSTPPESGERPLLTLDVHDHIDPASRDWVTLDEHGAIVRSEAHEARAAQLALRFEDWRGRQQLNAEQDRWARLVESR